MRFAAIGDIHGNLTALDAVLEDIGRRDLTKVVNLGDIASGGLFPVETVDRLTPLDLPTIRGNHERQLLTLRPEQMGLSDRYAASSLRPDQIAWVEKLPTELRLWGDVLLVHGTPASDVEYFLETVTETGLRRATSVEVSGRARDVRAEIILCGHTHLQREVRLDDGRVIVNPGSVGLPAYEDDRPYAHRVEAGSPNARYAVLERGSEGWRVELVALDYDWEQAARDAADRGRTDWVRPLTTGRV